MEQGVMTAMAVRLREEGTLDRNDLDALADGDGFIGRCLGLAWDAITPDEARAHLTVDQRHHQPFGIVHGGVWCSVVETMASIAAAFRVAESGRMPVGVSNATDFLRPVRQGRVDAVATPVHVGRTQQLWLVELARASDGRPVARGQVRLHNLEPSQVGGA